MNEWSWLAIALGALLAVTGCDDEDEDTDAGPDVEDSGPGGMDAGRDAGPDEDGGLDGGPTGPQPRGPDNVPALGAQIDRNGRPGITTALIGTFNPVEAEREAIKNAYNVDDDPSTWDEDYVPIIAGHLPVYDALDRTCGNQLAAGAAPIPGRYDALANVLADDRLYVDTSSGTCSTYLGVEAEALGLVAEGGCGGRVPDNDVIETTYSVLVNGSFDDFDDTVTAAEEDSTPSQDVFPFLDEPTVP